MAELFENILIRTQFTVRRKLRDAFIKASETKLECVGTIEIVLILVVLIGLVLIFKNQIRDLLSNVFTEINAQSTEVY